LLGIFFSIPFVAKYYTESNYPVKIGSVSFGFKGLEFGNVKVSRQDISGTLDNLTVDFNRNIIIDGGNIKYSFVKGRVQNKSTKNIIANNIKAKINYKDGTIEADGLSYINGLVSIEKAIVKNIGTIKGIAVSGVLNNLFINTKTRSGTVEYGTINTPYTSIDFDHLSFNKESFNISYTDIGNSLVVLYNSNINIPTKEAVSETAIINHPKLFSSQLTINNIEIKDIDGEFNVFANGAWFIIDPVAKRIRAKEHCQNWIDTLPKESLTKEIEQIKFNGSFGFDVSLDPVVVKINENCTLKNKPAFLNLHNTFTYTVYHSNKTPYKRISGPGSSEWIGINDISPNVAIALGATEDPAFFKHQGIIPKAFEVCLRERLNGGRICGGSTITMQLAKNLWLNREQTAGRKVQEIILTKALESLSKEQILELYVNVVEFGPDLYGIGPAAVKLLDTYPADLTLDEALYLSLRLPAPNKAGTLEQTKGFRKKILTGLAKTGKISEQELEETYFNGQD
jgi:hypothetical protein